MGYSACVMKEVRGGTSIDSHTWWLWPAIGGGALVLLLLVLASRDGDPMEEPNTDEGHEPSDDGYQDESRRPALDNSVPHDNSGAPVLGQGVAVAPREESAAGDAVDVDALLRDLLSPDSMKASRAGSQLGRLGLQDRAIPVLWQVVRTGDLSQLRRAQFLLEEWGVPRTFARTVTATPNRSASELSWHGGSLEVDGNQLIVELSYWVGDELFGGSNPPYIEVSTSGPGSSTAVKKVLAGPGDNHLREVVASGIGAGRYEANVFLWGQNTNTKLQLNVSVPTLEVTKP